MLWCAVTSCRRENVRVSAICRDPALVGSLVYASLSSCPLEKNRSMLFVGMKVVD